MSGRYAPRPICRGFTLVELLIVILILSILMAVALPMYVDAMANAERRTCRANMQTIANAEQAYKSVHSPHVYIGFGAGDNIAAALPDLTTTPVCPRGGQYSVVLNQRGDGTFTVHCTLAVHDGQGAVVSGFTPGKDQQ